MKKEQSTNVTVNQGASAAASKTAFEVYDEFISALTALDTVPDLLQLLIENYHLNQSELTQGQKIDLGNGYKQIHSVLYTVQNALWETIDKIEQIELSREGQQ